MARRRLRQLYRNGGLWGVVRMALIVGLVLVVAALAPIARPDYWPLSLGGVLGLTLPYFIRRPLVARVDRVAQIHRFAGIGILIAIVLLQEPIKRASPVVLALCLAIMGAYISIYFWLLSDPEVSTERGRKAARHARLEAELDRLR